MITMDRITLSKREKDMVSDVLESGKLSQGGVVKKFEDKFIKFFGCSHAIAVNSGTAAIHLALEAYGVRGREVITSAYSHISTANMIIMAGAKPVFADIDINTLCISWENVAPLITSNTKAIMPVHLFGAYPSDYKDFIKSGIGIINDSCQAHGSRYACGNGVASAFSFYATKNMTTGEGGMVTCNDSDMANHIRAMRRHGLVNDHHSYFGYNYKMTDILAAIGYCQIDMLVANNHHRDYLAFIYNDQLASVKGIVTPLRQTGRIFHRYTIRLTDEFPLSLKDFKNYMSKHGIETRSYYNTPIHLQPFYIGLGYDNVSLPNTEEAAKSCISIPCSPHITSEQAVYISSVIKAAIQ
jgi:perosamine synthetase